MSTEKLPIFSIWNILAVNWEVILPNDLRAEEKTSRYDPSGIITLWGLVLRPGAIDLRPQKTAPPDGWAKPTFEISQEISTEDLVSVSWRLELRCNRWHQNCAHVFVSFMGKILADRVV